MLIIPKRLLLIRKWAVDALRAVNVDVLEDQPGVEPKGDAKWDVAE